MTPDFHYHSDKHFGHCVAMNVQRLYVNLLLARLSNKYHFNYRNHISGEIAEASIPSTPDGQRC